MEGKKSDSKILLFTLLLILITLLLLNWVLSNNKTDEIWNYKEITTAANITYLGEKVEDRQTYYTLESIVQQYLNSYIDNYSNNESENNLKYTEYYNYLAKIYKRYLTKSEYNEVAKKFLEKFYVKATSEYESSEYMDIEKVIKEIYVFENNVYLCRLESSFTSNTGYIAIALDTNQRAYNILYIE